MKKLLLKTMLLLFALIAGTSMSWADETITVNFESNAIPAGWTASNFTVVSNPVTNDANGSYACSTDGKSTATLTYDAKVSKVKSISVDATRTSTNTKGTMTIEFSTDKSDWSKAQTQTVTIERNSWTTSTLTLASATDGYVRINFSGTTAVKYIDNIVITYESSGTPTCATPTFSPASGTVLSSAEIAIDCATTDATIYYTTDGTDPTTSSSVYSDPIPVSATIKAFAVKAGSDDSEVATANYTIIPAISGYNVNFESELFAYTDWTITNLTKTNETISAKTGDYFAKTNGTTTASVQTKEKVSNPGTFTCYVSKQTNNTTSSTWYIQVSEDGSEWTDVKSQDATSMDKGVWVEFTADLTDYSDVYVRLYYSGSTAVRNVDDISLTLASSVAVPTPTFTVAGGTYYEAQNVKVDNYDSDYMYFYTTDGTTPDCDGNWDPTGTSVAYNHATGIDISATTTLKIIAVDDDVNKSNVASATYTIETPLTTIAAVKALSSGDTFGLDLTGAQVVFIDGAKKNIYVRDASGAIVLFNKDGFTTTLTTGDILSGVIEGQYSPYKGLPEIINIADISVLTATDNSTVVAKVITGTTEAIAANLCDLVKIENTEISESDSKYYVGTSSDIQLYDNFSVGYTTTTGQRVDVSGIATVFNTTYELFPRFESDIVYLSSAEEVSIGDAGIATFCSEHALDFTGTDAIAVYTAAASGNRVILTQIHKVPANTGVILMNALGMNKGAVAAVNVPYLDDDADDVSGNELVGITAATVVNAMSAGKYNYILSNETAGVGFYKAVNGVQLAANKAYLSTTVNAAVRDFLGFTEDDSDAIIEIAKNEKMSAIYDLSGRRVVKPTKGLYIVNGKKVVK